MRVSPSEIVFIDSEIDFKGKKVLDIGAITGDGREFHSSSIKAFSDFIQGCKYICGHNILNHDLKYLGDVTADSSAEFFIDTLYLSPLLFPKKPYHRLVKDDKLAADELNNPFNDAKKARDLFYDELAEFKKLNKNIKLIYRGLLGGSAEFESFFHYIGSADSTNNIAIAELISEAYSGSICENAQVLKMIGKYPVELAYALAQIKVIKYDSITPPWVLHRYPRVENILHFLRNKKCKSSCPYCNESMDASKSLKRFFNFSEFRSYNGEALQKEAVDAAIEGKSIIVVLPTGGGKSITFQLPALIAGANEKGLTVVISPLQSLMKDQTDNLETQYNITEAATINGALDPLERAKAYERVENGSVSILYISPESLRSRSIESLLLKRNVVRFVIDEAHCLSAWGHDFRVDYLYIAKFLKGLQKKKNMSQSIPVSCFSATAKTNVITDIKSYFQSNLALELEDFKASAMRVNLKYHVFPQDGVDEKDRMLKQLLIDNDCPTIVYVSKVRRTEILAAKLTAAGFPAKPYNGRMDRQIRVETQDSFMRGDVNIIVATSAFGMGVDKKDVGLVIHYDISDSLENYLQEAGRAGRDESISADCYAFFSDEDLNRNFIRLNQTKLSLKEIQQIWKAVKSVTRFKAETSQSALEIARAAGWDDSVEEMETRVKTAINALEQPGFLRRGQNMPRIFADSILVKNMEEAKSKIDKSARFDDASRTQAVRIMGSLISAKNKARGAGDDGEDRVDYISDRLGIVKEDVIRVIGLLREESILADAKDLVAYIRKGDRKSRSDGILESYKSIEEFLFRYLSDEENTYNIKDMNEHMQEAHPDGSIKQLNTIINYYDIKRFVKRTPESNKNYVTLKPYSPISEIKSKSLKRFVIAEAIISHLFLKTVSVPEARDSRPNENSIVEFSVLELKEAFAHNLFGEKAETEEIEDALYYLLKIGAIRVEGGFLVIYNAMHIERLKTDSKTLYKKTDYAQLEDYYESKRQQIHIVGEYAVKMMDDYSDAMLFVNDYFSMEYDFFLQKYFNGRQEEISRNITPAKFEALFGGLSDAQREIIKDQKSKHIVVAAGPGSGKTKLLTHKLASLYTMEDVKHEQMLMLTFSRAAATEFKRRLITLIGNAAHFIQITTYHSYCFDLLGRVGDLEKSDKIIEQTVERIMSGEVDIIRLTKTVLVIDEAQDMSAAEYSLVKTLIECNSGLRVIAVGDDDQNIYEFRGSSAAHLESFISEYGAKKYELTVNYRSNANIVDFANSFASGISHRLKTTPIAPVKKELGTISVCKLRSVNLAEPVVNAVLDLKPSGSTCIAARTNEEALNIAGLLLKNGIPAQQIQTNSDFNLYNLVEIRAFVDDIDAADSGYTISDELWQAAKLRLSDKYSASGDLPGVFRLLRDFEETNSGTKYISDLKQFIRESKLDDFISGSNDSILVSTIHQTKGREFDNVFLAYNRSSVMNDETKRAVYVAITRAKQNLHIFSNGSYFDKIKAENYTISYDDTAYDAPSLVCIQLSHTDVALSFCSYRRREIDTLRSSQELPVTEEGCYLGDNLILKFSAKFRAQIKELQEKGYALVRAEVRHVVFWQGKDMDNEIKIVLPNVELQKSPSNNLAPSSRA